MKIEYVLYIINFLSNLNWLWNVCALIAAVVSLMCLFLWCHREELEGTGFAKLFILTKKVLTYFVIFTIFILFVPSEKTMYMMAGATLLKESAIPSKVSQVIELKLDEIIKNENPLKDKDKDKS